MPVAAELKKCVVFLGFKMADGGMRFAGSAFFLGDRNSKLTYLVTAKHVIDGIRSIGLEEVYVRVNGKNGESVWSSTRAESWIFHPDDRSVDVAMMPVGPTGDHDHLVVDTSMCLNQEVERANEVDVGDDVWIVGLFKHHHGKSKNIPIVRKGSLAARAEEKVMTKGFGEIDAHLIEVRSIGGLSGSPVFLSLGVARLLGGTVKFAQNSQQHYLLGLIHGHYDVAASQVDDAFEHAPNSLSDEKINTGIAIVVPVEKILEVIAGYKP